LYSSEILFSNSSTFYKFFLLASNT